MLNVYFVDLYISKIFSQYVLFTDLLNQNAGITLLLFILFYCYFIFRRVYCTRVDQQCKHMCMAL